MQSRSSAMGSLVVLTAAWGTIPLIVRSVDLSSQQLVAMRLWLGALPLLVVLLARGVPRMSKSHWWRVVGLGALLAFHWVAFFWSLNTTTVAIALLLVYLAPVAMATLAPIVLGEPLRSRAAAALAIALVGVVLVARPGEGATTEGVISGLVAAATFAGLVLAGKPVAQQIGPLRLAALETTVAALLMTPWMLTALPDVGQSWWQLAILGVILTGVAGYVYWRSVSLPPRRHRCRSQLHGARFSRGVGRFVSGGDGRSAHLDRSRSGADRRRDGRVAGAGSRLSRAASGELETSG